MTMLAFAPSIIPRIPHPALLPRTSKQPCISFSQTTFRGAHLHTRVSTSTPSSLKHVALCYSDQPSNRGGGGDDDYGDYDEDYAEEDVEVILPDPSTGRVLSAGVEHTMNYDGATYALCYPVDDPVAFACVSDDGSALQAVDDDAVIRDLFPTAEAVLSEDHILLKDTPFVLTVDDQGESLDAEEDDDDEADYVDDDEIEEEEEDVEIIAEFLYSGKEYFVVRPTEPTLLLAEQLSDGYRVLESPELDHIAPIVDKYIENLESAAPK